MSEQQKQQRDKEEDIRSMEGSEWSLEEENIVGHGDAKQNAESSPKIALLEVKILEGKLENMELKAQIRAMTEEDNLNKLKEENKAIRARMEAAEEKANKLEENIQEIQEMAIQTEEQLKGQMQDLEEKNLKEMANLNELLKSQGINLDHMQSADIPWTDLIKDKKLANPTVNRWEKEENSTGIQISEDGLNVTIPKWQWRNVFTEEEFCLSIEDCRENNFSGLIIYYFEVKQMPSKPSGRISVGLSNGNIPHMSNVNNSPNCYVLWDGDDFCYLSGKLYAFKSLTGANKPEWNGQGDVVGCGILMSPANKVSIFFTLNGILMGKKIPIGHPGDSLFPTVRMRDASVEANFGGDSVKPFRYDIDKCPGLDME